MMFLFFVLLYIMICETIYIAMLHLYDNEVARSLKAPKLAWLFYLLQFTWGLPMNIIGGLVALILLCCGKRPKRHGWNIYFELPVNFGLELGIFFIAPVNDSLHTKNHELGHSIQNIYFGPFTIGAVCIPSAARFWFLELMYRIRGEQETEYDAIWFEGQATNSGTEFYRWYKEKGEDD